MAYEKGRVYFMRLDDAQKKRFRALGNLERRHFAEVARSFFTAALDHWESKQNAQKENQTAQG